MARRMKKLGLRGIQAKKFKVTTDSNHSKPVAPDLVGQDFTATHANQKLFDTLESDFGIVVDRVQDGLIQLRKRPGSGRLHRRGRT